MKIRKIDDLKSARDLVWEVFLRYEAPTFGPKGTKTFKNFINDENLIKTFEFFGAYEKDALAGVIARR